MRPRSSGLWAAGASSSWCPRTAPGAGEIAKSAVLTGILAHNSEMYGIATIYLRAKNLVPPSTKRALNRPRG